MEDEGIEILSDDPTSISTDSVEVKFEEIDLSKLNNKSIENNYKKTKVVSKSPSRKPPRFSKNIDRLLRYFQKPRSNSK